jgi:frataxin
MQGFTDARYNDCCDQFLDHVMQVVEERDSPLVNDVDCSAGVLTIDTKNGTFIINKQAPKLQLWLSSPISGAHHYDMVEKTSPLSEPVVLVGGVDVSKSLGSVVWLSDKDKHCLTEKLERELSKCIEFEVRL